MSISFLHVPTVLPPVPYVGKEDSDEKKANHNQHRRVEGKDSLEKLLLKFLLGHVPHLVK